MYPLRALLVELELRGIFIYSTTSMCGANSLYHGGSSSNPPAGGKPEHASDPGNVKLFSAPSKGKGPGSDGHGSSTSVTFVGPLAREGVPHNSN